jgi:hypothetical protein
MAIGVRIAESGKNSNCRLILNPYWAITEEGKQTLKQNQPLVIMTFEYGSLWFHLMMHSIRQPIYLQKIFQFVRITYNL